MFSVLAREGRELNTMSEMEALSRRAAVLVGRARSLLDKASPGPWEVNDSGYVSDREGFVVAHVTARRGAKLWQQKINPNAEFVTEAHELLEELSDVLQKIVESHERGEAKPSLKRDRGEL